VAQEVWMDTFLKQKAKAVFNDIHESKILWQHCGTNFLDWIPFLPQKVKAVLKIFHEGKFCGKIVAQAIL